MKVTLTREEYSRTFELRVDEVFRKRPKYYKWFTEFTNDHDFLSYPSIQAALTGMKASAEAAGYTVTVDPTEKPTKGPSSAELLAKGLLCRTHGNKLEAYDLANDIARDLTNRIDIFNDVADWMFNAGWYSRPMRAASPKTFKLLKTLNTYDSTAFIDNPNSLVEGDLLEGDGESFIVSVTPHNNEVKIVRTGCIGYPYPRVQPKGTELRHRGNAHFED